MKKRKVIHKTIPVKIPSKHSVLYDCIFNQQVDVFLNYTPEKYKNWLNREKIKDVDNKYLNNFAGWTGEYTDENDKQKVIIFIPKFDWTIKDQGTLVHEIVHAIIKIWSRNNIQFNSDTQEFLAHSISNLYEDTCRKLLVKMK